MDADHTKPFGPLLLPQVKLFYEQFSTATIARLDDIYTPDVEFRDPVHTLHGSLRLKGYLRRMAASITHYEMRYLDEVADANSAYLTWELDYAHRRLRGGQIITVRGMSQLRFTSRVYYHEDSYDLGALLYEHIPGLGFATRQVKQLLTRQD
jgi:hypothetical protein